MKRNVFADADWCLQMRYCSTRGNPHTAKMLHEDYGRVAAALQKALVTRGMDAHRAAVAVQVWQVERERRAVSDPDAAWELWRSLNDPAWRPDYPFDEFGVAA